MTSQQIIIRLIDEKLINGEEAYTLLNDILKGEIVNCWETLNENSDKTSKTISIASPY